MPARDCRFPISALATMSGRKCKSHRHHRRPRTHAVALETANHHHHHHHHHPPTYHTTGHRRQSVRCYVLSVSVYLSDHTTTRTGWTFLITLSLSLSFAFINFNC